MPLCCSWPIPVTDSPNTGLKKMSKVKPHRWLETSWKMFKHFVREGHTDRSSLRQSTQDRCLQSIKCPRCQSVGMSKIEDGTGHVTRWLLSMWTFYFIYLLFIFTSRCFKQEQTADTVTDCTLQVTIAQIVWVPAWQTRYPTRRWRNHMQHDTSFSCLIS